MIKIKNTLVVDLDETLINTNILYETFWSAFSKDWKIPFKSLCWLLSGKAYLKERLGIASNINVKQLPYNREVIDYIKKHRKKGGYTFLATASNYSIAEKISKHLKLFDEIKGSSNKFNLKGNDKAKFLKNRFGLKNYDYIGDSLIDLPVWKYANKAIVVSNNQSVYRSCQKVNSFCHQIKSKKRENNFSNFIKTIRAYQWIKNLLVFLPMLTAHLVTIDNLKDSFFSFIAFSLIASSVYIVNDLLDLNSDRAHPYKKLRPFASGAVSTQNGFTYFLILFISSVILSLYIGINFFLLILSYWIFNLIYSLIFKKIPLLDLFVLALLYTSRVLAGGLATDIEISIWLFAFAFFFFFSLASVKRCSELTNIKNRKTKLVGRDYNADDLPILNILAWSSGFISILVAVLYINSPDVFMLYRKPELLLGICIVLLLWLIKIILDSNRGMIKIDPIIYALRDKYSWVCLMFIVSILYLNFI